MAFEPQAAPSFFTSWSWIGAWLRSLPPATPTFLVSVLRSGAPIAHGIFCFRTIRRHGMRVRQLYLHECGIREFDSLRIECNGLLTRRGAETEAVRGLLRGLERHPRLPRWDELVLSGIDAVPLWRQEAAKAGLLQDEVSMPSHYVDLEAVRAGGKGYLDVLVSKTRRKIKGSMREYSARHGGLRCDISTDATQAAQYLETLQFLHQENWIAKGQPGAFANPGFTAFHRDLVAREHEAGGVRLLRVSCGEQTLGMLYVLIRDGVVAFYQSGYRFGLVEKHDIPGIVAIAVAIERLCAEGYRSFEFLAGKQQYKSELGTGTRERSWMVLQQRRPGLLLERLVRRLNRYLKARRERPAGKPVTE
jgi:CelD/BcsL family acetyltransferase involved in cellulose biosynthesis